MVHPWECIIFTFIYDGGCVVIRVMLHDFLVGVILQAGLELLSFTKEYERIQVQCVVSDSDKGTLS